MTPKPSTTIMWKVRVLWHVNRTTHAGRVLAVSTPTLASECQSALVQRDDTGYAEWLPVRDLTVAPARRSA